MSENCMESIHLCWSPGQPTSLGLFPGGPTSSLYFWAEEMLKLASSSTPLPPTQEYSDTNLAILRELFLSGLANLFFPLLCILLRAVAASTPTEGRLMSDFPAPGSQFPFSKCVLKMQHGTTRNFRVSWYRNCCSSQRFFQVGILIMEWIWMSAYLASEQEGQGHKLMLLSEERCWKINMWRHGGGKSVLPWNVLLLLKAESEVTLDIIVVA